ncbi:MAG: protein-export chaperone SecB [Gammaproteobacteria bacterium]|nr:protein-export chaperone SecB [Gammaproteobacteria bacterium]
MSDSLEQQPGQGQFAIQKIYIKDVSFETPNSPHIFLEKWEPEVNLQIGNNASTLSEGVHEVVLSLTVTAKLGDKVAYLIEVQQAGIFNINGFGGDDLAAVVGSYCPNILFPYAREAVSDLVTKGGFPQMLLAPVNFDALYAQHVQQQRQTAQPSQVAH